MNRFLSFLIVSVLSASLFAACTQADERFDRRENVFLDEGNSGSNSGEVAIDESSVTDAETQALIERNSFQESDKTASDGSKISTMYDGFGNKTERRFFHQHPLIEAMVLRTSTDGQKEVLLFGYNGEVKTVPQNMIDRAMTASADELAQAAGILQGRKPKMLSFSDFAGSTNDVSSPPVSKTSSDLQNAEPEKPESQNPKTKPAAQNVRQAELEYQAEINKVILKAKKSQTAKNNENINENR